MRRATLALLFITCMLVACLLTYMITSGYWYSLGVRPPNKPAIAIEAVGFPLDDTSYFNLTVLNPSYSPGEVEVESVLVMTPDMQLHKVEKTEPSLPLKLSVGNSTTITCHWDWANYTGQELAVIVPVKGGSGAIFKAVPPTVKLVLKVTFNASRPFWFLLNVTNARESETSVRVSGVDVMLANGTKIESLLTEPSISATSPKELKPGDSVVLNCTWHWLAYRNKTATVIVRTVEGYRGYLSCTTPPPVIIKITELTFAIANGQPYINITIFNEPASPAPARICNITVRVGEELFVFTNTTPSLRPPYVLQPNASVTFTCYWNWTAYEGRNATFRVETKLGYRAETSVRVEAGTTKLSGALRAVSARPTGVGDVQRLSGPRSGNVLSWRAPRLSAPPAQRRTSALCALGLSRRSNRPGWLLLMPSL